MKIAYRKCMACGTRRKTNAFMTNSGNPTEFCCFCRRSGEARRYRARMRYEKQKERHKPVFVDYHNVDDMNWSSPLLNPLG